MRDVLLTVDAERDLEELVEYIAEFDSPAIAQHILDRVLEVTTDLSTHAERGSIPRELRSLGIREYRQVFFKPYRVIYRVDEHRVLVYVIADGRGTCKHFLPAGFWDNKSFRSNNQASSRNRSATYH